MSIQLRIALFSCPVVIALGLVGCSSDGTAGGVAKPLSVEQRSTRAAEVVKVDVRAQADNFVALQTLPRARCHLYSEERPAEGTELGSADDGMVVFQFTPELADKTAYSNLDCQDSTGAIAKYSIELRSRSDVPALTAPKPKGRIRPPLSGDPNALTQAQLHALGFPSRPDHVKNPDRYKRWLDLASKPMTIVSPSAGITRSQRFASWTPNWAGVEVTANSGTTYLGAYGQWYIPNVLKTAQNKDSGLASWVGIYGVESGIWQAGTDTNIYWNNGYQADTYAWYEFIDKSGPCCLAQPITLTYPLAVKDEVYFELALTDLDGNLSITGNDDTQYLCALYVNLTQGWQSDWQATTIAEQVANWRYYKGDYSTPIDTTLNGQKVGLIAERQNNLPRFLPAAYFIDGYTMDQNGSWTWFGDSSYDRILMKNFTTNNILATTGYNNISGYFAFQVNWWNYY